MLYNTTPNETKGLKIVPLSQSEQQAGCACQPWPHMSENRVPYFNPNSNAFLSLMFAHVFFPFSMSIFFSGVLLPGIWHNILMTSAHQSCINFLILGPSTVGLLSRGFQKNRVTMNYIWEFPKSWG